MSDHGVLDNSIIQGSMVILNTLDMAVFVLLVWCVSV